MRFCFHCGHALALWEDHGVERLRCPACGYITYDNAKPRAADDAVDVRWFDADDLPERMAFPDHAYRVLADWREWIEHPKDFGLRT